MNFVEKIDSEIQETKTQMERLTTAKKLVAEFPDLHESQDRWQKKYYVSALVNEKAEKVKFGHSCGCCSDSPLLAYFYVERGGIPIYADPFSICIGAGNEFGWGDIPKGNWQKILKDHRIPDHFTKEVEAYFQQNKPEPFEDDEEVD